MNIPVPEHKSGYAAIVGRPNVGKSTLLNALVGQKISIITHKPQTTRHRILGIYSRPDAQIIFVDTPGFHLKQSHAINRYMNKAALSALHDVDVILFVVEAGRWTREDAALAEKLQEQTQPVIAVINKVDVVADKRQLLEEIERLNRLMKFQAIVPISAQSGDGLDTLRSLALERLPAGEPYFDPEQVTDRSLRFLAAEEIREKLFLHVHAELPYALTVQIDDFTEEEKLYRIRATVWVERKSHKGMVIGKDGALLKRVGTEARKSLQDSFGRKIFLELWVKVKEGWSDDERALQSLGYHDSFQ
ncbi:MAG TPA: GTPase Era [Gammaproteobacteria bacterium]|nr:GTPase Era [Gammaproteobacteria bacterium]